MIEKPVPLPDDGSLPGAGFGIRAAARIIDTIGGLCLAIVGGIFAGIALMLLTNAGLIQPGWETRVQSFSWYGTGFGLLGNVIYHTLTEALYGASLGKLICGLRVGRQDGQPIGVRQAFQRSVAYFWDALFFGLVAYSAMKQSPQNQRYGDRWAKTIVLRKATLPPGPRPGVELFVLAFLMGTVAWAAMHALGLILAAR